MIKTHRNHQSYWAFLGLRLSGIALTPFLPMHFLMLGLALEGSNTMDRYLTMTNVLPIKLAEWGLVMLLALHFFFGIRLLVLELLPWPNPQDLKKPWINVAGGGAILIGIIFLIRAL
jgi:fumarate reductase subunit D